MTEKRIIKLLSCDNCKFATCEQCEISYSDKQLIKKYIEAKDKQIERYQNMLVTNDMLHIKESQEKDKIIDLMAEYIEGKKFFVDKCFNVLPAKIIKQHFESIAKGE